MKAVIYARYSSDKQREESIEAQLRVCHEFAKKNKIIIVNEYCDRALSARTDKRPEFQRMIYDSDQHKFDAIVMYAVDRFARNRYDAAKYKTRLKRNGVSLLYVTQPMADNPESIIMESLLEGMAEYYSANLSRSVKRGIRENALKHYAQVSPIPLGYRVGPDRHYEIEPKEEPIVKYVFESYVNDNKPIKRITRELNDKGYRNRKGKPFVDDYFRRLMKNPIYKGVYKFMDIYDEDAVPAIISKELFDKAQERRAMNKKHKRRTSPNSDEVFLLTGKIFCECGKSMVGDCGTSKSGKVYRYYTCIGKKNDKICDAKSIAKQKIEDLVIDMAMKVVLDDDNIERIAKRTVEVLDDQYADTSLLESLKANSAETQRKIEAILDAIEQGIITKSTKSRLEALETEHERLRQAIDEEEYANQKPPITESMVINWLKLFRIGNVDDYQFRSRLINTLVHKIVIFKDGRVGISYNTTEVPSTELSCSDIVENSPPFITHPNIYIPIPGILVVYTWL